MTKAAAEKIMGLEVREIPVEGTQGKRFSERCFAAFDGETEIARVSCSGVKMTIERLVYVVYQRRSEQTRREQGFRCFSCGRVGVGLEIDHIVMRSAGRSDARSNLRALCHEDHAARHNQPRTPLRPHPEVLKHMRSYGWEWLDPIRGWGRISEASPTVGPEATLHG